MLLKIISILFENSAIYGQNLIHFNLEQKNYTRQIINIQEVQIQEQKRNGKGNFFSGKKVFPLPYSLQKTHDKRH